MKASSITPTASKTKNSGLKNVALIIAPNDTLDWTRSVAGNFCPQNKMP